MLNYALEMGGGVKLSYYATEKYQSLFYCILLGV